MYHLLPEFIKRSPQRFTWACVLVFLSFCFLHYFSFRPLWLDENFVFENIKNKDIYQLFGPLNMSQSFPRVHLVLIKMFSEMFDYGLLSLRLFSFVFMMTAFLLWYRIYKINFTNPWLLFLGLLSFACSYRMTYYSAELKPYAMDVLVSALFCLFIHYQRQFESAKPKQVAYVTTAILPLLLFFSYAGIFFFWIVPFNYFLILRKNKDVARVLLLSVFCSVLCFVGFYYFDLRHSVTATLENYWESYFICSDSILCFLDTFGDGIKKLVTYWYGTEKGHIRAAVIFIPFFMWGLYGYGFKQLKRDRFNIFKMDSLGFIVFFELIVFGFLHKYPFTGARLTLFFAPYVFYFVLMGMSDLSKRTRIAHIFLWYYGGYCGFCLINTLLIYLRLYQK